METELVRLFAPIRHTASEPTNDNIIPQMSVTINKYELLTNHIVVSARQVCYLRLPC